MKTPQVAASPSEQQWLPWPPQIRVALNNALVCAALVGMFNYLECYSEIKAVRTQAP